MAAFEKIQRVIGLLQKNFECPICLELMKNPVSTKCGHQFCNFCAQEAIRKRPVAPCPICKESITKRSLRHCEQLSDIISSVQALTSAFEADTGIEFSLPPGPLLSVSPVKTPQTEEEGQHLSQEDTDELLENFGTGNKRKRARERLSDSETNQSEVNTQVVKRRSLERRCKSNTEPAEESCPAWLEQDQRNCSTAETSNHGNSGEVTAESRLQTIRTDQQNGQMEQVTDNVSQAASSTLQLSCHTRQTGRRKTRSKQKSTTGQQEKLATGAGQSTDTIAQPVHVTGQITDQGRHSGTQADNAIEEPAQRRRGKLQTSPFSAKRSKPHQATLGGTASETGHSVKRLDSTTPADPDRIVTEQAPDCHVKQAQSADMEVGEVITTHTCQSGSVTDAHNYDNENTYPDDVTSVTANDVTGKQVNDVTDKPINFTNKQINVTDKQVNDVAGKQINVTNKQINVTDKQIIDVTGKQVNDVTVIDVDNESQVCPDPVHVDLDTATLTRLQQWVMDVDQTCHPTPQCSMSTDDDYSQMTDISEARLKRRIFKSRGQPLAESKTVNLNEPTPCSQKSDDPYSFKSSQKTPKASGKQKSRVGRKTVKTYGKKGKNRKNEKSKNHNALLYEHGKRVKLSETVESLGAEQSLSDCVIRNDTNIQDPCPLVSNQENMAAVVTESQSKENQDMTASVVAMVSKKQRGKSRSKRRGKNAAPEITFSQLTREEVAHLESKISEAESFDLCVEGMDLTGQTDMKTNSTQLYREDFQNPAAQKMTGRTVSQQWRAVKQMAHDLQSPARGLAFLPLPLHIKKMSTNETVREMPTETGLTDSASECDVIIDNETVESAIVHSSKEEKAAEIGVAMETPAVPSIGEGVETAAVCLETIETAEALSGDDNNTDDTESLDLGLTQEAHEAINMDIQPEEIKQRLSQILESQSLSFEEHNLSLPKLGDNSMIIDTTENADIVSSLQDNNVIPKDQEVTIPSERREMTDKPDKLPVTSLSGNHGNKTAPDTPAIAPSYITETTLGTSHPPSQSQTGISDHTGCQERKAMDSPKPTVISPKSVPDSSKPNMECHSKTSEDEDRINDEVSSPCKNDNEKDPEHFKVITQEDKPDQDGLLSSPEDQLPRIKKSTRRTFTLGSSPPSLEGRIQRSSLQKNTSDLAGIMEAITDSEMVELMAVHSEQFSEEGKMDSQSRPVEVMPSSVKTSNDNDEGQTFASKTCSTDEVIPATDDASGSLTQVINIPLPEAGPGKLNRSPSDQTQLRSAETQQRSGHTQRRSDETQQRSGHTQRRSGETQQRSGHTQQRSDETQQRSGHTQRRSDETQQRSGHTQRRSGETQQRSGHTQRRSGEAQQRSGHTQQRSDETQQRSGHTQRRSGETQQRSGHTQAKSGHTQQDSGHIHQRSAHTQQDLGHTQQRSGHAQQDSCHTQDRSNGKSKSASEQGSKKSSDISSEIPFHGDDFMLASLSRHSKPNDVLSQTDMQPSQASLSILHGAPTKQNNIGHDEVSQASDHLSEPDHDQVGLKGSLTPKPDDVIIIDDDFSPDDIFDEGYSQRVTLRNMKKETSDSDDDDENTVMRETPGVKMINNTEGEDHSEINTPVTVDTAIIRTQTEEKISDVMTGCAEDVIVKKEPSTDKETQARPVSPVVTSGGRRTRSQVRNQLFADKLPVKSCEPKNKPVETESSPANSKLLSSQSQGEADNLQQSSSGRKSGVRAVRGLANRRRSSQIKFNYLSPSVEKKSPSSKEVSGDHENTKDGSAEKSNMEGQMKTEVDHEIKKEDATSNLSLANENPINNAFVPPDLIPASSQPRQSQTVSYVAPSSSQVSTRSTDSGFDLVPPTPPCLVEKKTDPFISRFAGAKSINSTHDDQSSYSGASGHNNLPNHHGDRVVTKQRVSRTSVAKTEESGCEEKIMFDHDSPKTEGLEKTEFDQNSDTCYDEDAFDEDIQSSKPQVHSRTHQTDNVGFSDVDNTSEVEGSVNVVEKGGCRDNYLDLEAALQSSENSSDSDDSDSLPDILGPNTQERPEKSRKPEQAQEYSECLDSENKSQLLIQIEDGETFDPLEEDTSFCQQRAAGDEEIEEADMTLSQQGASGDEEIEEADMTLSQQRAAAIANAQADLDLIRQIQEAKAQAANGSGQTEEEDEQIPHTCYNRRSVIHDDESDNESYISDASDHRSNNTAVSATSSQSEILTTQQQAQLRNELEKMEDEIVQLQEALENAPEDSVLTPTERQTIQNPVRRSAQPEDLDENNPPFDQQEVEMSTQGSVESVQTSVSHTSASLHEFINEQVESAVSPLPPTPPTPSLKHHRASTGGLKLLPGVQRAADILEKYKSPSHSHSKPSQRVQPMRGCSTPSQQTHRTTSSHGDTASCDTQSSTGAEPKASNTANATHKIKTEADDATKADKANHSSEQKCSQTRQANRKRSLSIVATGLSVGDKDLVSEFANSFGAKLHGKYSSSTTHVIVKPDSTDARMCQRTLKYFQGLAAGVWIVSVKWVVDCLKQSCLIPETAYEIRGDVVTGTEHGGPARSRLSTSPLLRGYELYCHGEFSAMSKEEVCSLAEACGAEIVTDLLYFTYKPGYIQIMLTQPPDSQVNHPTIPYDRIFRGFNALTVSREWLLDSLCKYEVQDMDDYILCSEKTFKKWLSQLPEKHQ